MTVALAQQTAELQAQPARVEAAAEAGHQLRAVTMDAAEAGHGARNPLVLIRPGATHGGDFTAFGAEAA